MAYYTGSIKDAKQMYIRLDIWEPLSSLNPGRHLEEDVKLYATIKVLTKSRGIIKKPKTSTVAQ